MKLSVYFSVTTLLLLWSLLLGCPKKPSDYPDRWKDAEPADAEEAKRDPCVLAGNNLKTACPKLWKSDEYWVGFCHTMVDGGVPLCPTKLAHVKTCAEANEVCR